MSGMFNTQKRRCFTSLAGICFIYHGNILTLIYLSCIYQKKSFHNYCTEKYWLLHYAVKLSQWVPVAPTYHRGIDWSFFVKFRIFLPQSSYVVRYKYSLISWAFNVHFHHTIRIGRKIHCNEERFVLIKEVVNLKRNDSCCEVSFHMALLIVGLLMKI